MLAGNQPIQKTSVFDTDQKTPVHYTLLAGVGREAEFSRGLSTVASKFLIEVIRLQQIVFAEIGDLSEVVLIRDIVR